MSTPERNAWGTGRCTRRQLLGATLGGLATAGMGDRLAAAGAPSPTAQRGWPQWRGPLGNGVSPTADPPTKWSETSNVRWKVKLPGSGTGTPIIWNDQVLVQAAVPGADPNGPIRFTLLSLDRRTGKIAWQKVAREEVPHEGHHRDHGYASQSPVTDGRYLVSFFGSRGLHCYDLQGNLKWTKQLGQMRTRNGFGEGSSAALSGDTVVVNWDHEGEDFIAAFDAATGKERWRQPRDEPTSWATPLIVEHGGRAQVISTATNKIRSYDLATGKPVWECAGMTTNTIPSPVANEEMVYVMSGFRGNSLLAIRLGREGDLTGTDAIAWSHRRNTPYVPSPLLYGDRLYFFSNNSGILSCFHARTGKALIDAVRIDALPNVYASPVGAAGRVYLVGRNGAMVVLKDADQLEVLATNKLEDGFEASPAVAGNELFLRGREHLYCIAGK